MQAEKRARRHTCHAEDCTTQVPPKMFMCRKHWRMVPKLVRQQIWRHYEPGQENFFRGGTIRPSEEYRQWAMRAVNAVKALEAFPSEIAGVSLKLEGF